MPTKGPVLFVHGAEANWTSFLDVADATTEVPLPVRLAFEGYDVYLVTRRGGVYQTNCGSSAFCSDEELYWNSVKAQEIGATDITGIVKSIIDYRARSVADYPCQKVKIIAHDSGAVEAIHALNEAGMGDYVEKLINLAPCAIHRTEWPGFLQPAP